MARKLKLPKPPSVKEIEKQLVPRLRFMGIVLLFFCFSTLGYALFASPYLSSEDETVPILDEESIGLPSSTDELTPLELTQNERLNLYIVATSFALVGTCCLTLAWRKKKQIEST